MDRKTSEVLLLIEQKNIMNTTQNLIYNYIDSWSTVSAADAYVFSGIMEASKKRKPNPYIKTPSKEESIKSGKQAVLDIAHGVTDRVDRVMFKNGLGWISIEKGVTGKQPPTKGNMEKLLKWWKSLKTLDDRKEAPFRGGHGIAHIIAKRNWEGEHIEQLRGQSGLEVALALIQVIQNGIPKDDGGDKVIEKYDYKAVLRKVRSDSKDTLITGQNFWMWSGYKIAGRYDLRKEFMEGIIESADGRDGVDDPLCLPSDHRAAFQSEALTGEQSLLLRQSPADCCPQSEESGGSFVPTLSSLTLHGRGEGAADSIHENGGYGSQRRVSRKVPEYGTAEYGFTLDL